MVQVEMNHMYINTGANNGSEKLWTKRDTTTSDKLIKSVYALYVYVYIFFVQVNQVGQSMIPYFLD